MKRQQQFDQRIRDHFTTNADEYVDRYAAAHLELCQRRVETLRQHWPQDPGRKTRFLDVGSGPGTFADMVLDSWPNTTAYCVDVSTGMLARSSRRTGKVPVLADARNLPFPPASFDVINLEALLHHLVDRHSYRDSVAGINSTLAALRFLLKPDGLLMIREIYHEYKFKDNLGTFALYHLTKKAFPRPIARFLRAAGVRTANAGVCFLTRRQWSEAIKACGYTVLSLDDRPWLRHPSRLVGFCRNGDLDYILARS